MIRPAIAAATVAALAVSAVTGQAMAATWAVDATEDALTWIVPFAGETRLGRFERFDADIQFDPADPASASVTVVVDMSSVSTDNEEEDLELAKPEWLDIAGQPTATFTAQGFEPLEDGRYRAAGTLTLRGASNPQVLEFAFDVEGATAHVVGGTVIDRIAYGVGQGQWENDDVVGFSVQVNFDLALHLAD